MATGPTAPVLIDADGNHEHLRRMPLRRGSDNSFDEAWLQDLLFRAPSCLPLDEIDASFGQLIPLCREMHTPGGYVDLLFITPDGRLVIVEAKLWRNPEARRKVVGQILDYAKDFASFDFAQLDALVRRAQKASGAQRVGLVDTVRNNVPALDEATFCDAVSRSLRRGDFLLIIVGDGIHEGARGITEFLESYGTLNFTFGLVEVGVYAFADGRRLVQPRVLMQSVIAQRIVVEVAQGSDAKVSIGDDAGDGDEDNDNTELIEQRAAYTRFWTEFLHRLELDDQEQRVEPAMRGQNQYFNLAGGVAWISAFLAQSTGKVGVYITFKRNAVGQRLYEGLQADRAEIDAAIDWPLDWITTENSRGQKHTIRARCPMDGILCDPGRADVIEWLAARVNEFVTAFRPRVRELMDELDGG